jgi:hypothetical protein
LPDDARRTDRAPPLLHAGLELGQDVDGIGAILVRAEAAVEQVAGAVVAVQRVVAALAVST